MLDDPYNTFICLVDLDMFTPTNKLRLSPSFLYPSLFLVDGFTDDLGRRFRLTDVGTMSGLESKQVKLFGFLFQKVNSSLLKFRGQYFVTRVEDVRHRHVSVGRVHGLSRVTDGGLQRLSRLPFERFFLWDIRKDGRCTFQS